MRKKMAFFGDNNVLQMVITAHSSALFSFSLGEIYFASSDGFIKQTRFQSTVLRVAIKLKHFDAKMQNGESNVGIC